MVSQITEKLRPQRGEQNPEVTTIPRVLNQKGYRASRVQGLAVGRERNQVLSSWLESHCLNQRGVWGRILAFASLLHFTLAQMSLLKLNRQCLGQGPANLRYRAGQGEQGLGLRTKRSGCSVCQCMDTLLLRRHSQFCSDAFLRKLQVQSDVKIQFFSTWSQYFPKKLKNNNKTE